METVEMKKYYYPAQFTRKGIALLQSSEVFFFSVCSSLLTKETASEHETWVITSMSVPSSQRHNTFFTFLQGIASVSHTAARWSQGHHCLPQVMGRTLLRLHKLDSCYSLRAASSHISHQCTQKTSQQGCQVVWLGNNTPFVRKQCVLRQLWSAPRYDV